MLLTGKRAKRLVYVIFYTGITILIVRGGIFTINYSMESKFYRDYLMQWETSITEISSKKYTWPVFAGDNHSEYMDNLVEALKIETVPVPESNTNKCYIYKIDRIGFQNEELFLLCFLNRIIIYGISEKTFKKIDILIDGKNSIDKGKFTGRAGKNSPTLTGVWQL